MKLRNFIRGGAVLAASAALAGLIGMSSLTSAKTGSGVEPTGTTVSKPLFQSCPDGTYYMDQGNTYTFSGQGTIYSAYNDTPYQSIESFTVGVSIGTTETINGGSAFNLGFSDIINAGITSSSGHSVAKSMSYSGTVTQNVTTPAYQTAFVQAGFESLNSHGYVYDETVNCDSTDVYNVSNTESPYSHGTRGWLG